MPYYTESYPGLDNTALDLVYRKPFYDAESAPSYYPRSLNTGGRDHLSTLPNEMLFMVGKYLPTANLNFLFRTCKSYTIRLSGELYKRCMLDQGLSSLMWAAANNKCAVLCKLLDVYKVPVTLKTDHGVTALHCAALDGCVDAVSCLLKRGADVNAATIDLEEEPNPRDLELDRYQSFVVTYRVQVITLALRHPEVVQIILEHGPRLNDSITLYVPDTKTKVAQSLLVYAQNLCRMCGVDNDVELIQRLITSGADVNDARGQYTPLVFAIDAACNPDFIPILLENGADASLASAKYGYPLAAAILKGDEKVVEMLISYGGFVYDDLKNNFINIFEPGNRSRQNEMNLLNILFRELDAAGHRVEDQMLSWLLTRAMFWGSIDMIEMLLKRGADLKNTTEYYYAQLIFESRDESLL